MKNNGLFNKNYMVLSLVDQTVLQLIKILDDWPLEIDKGNYTDVIYMDFQKAFDTVPHKRLISKMN